MKVCLDTGCIDLLFSPSEKANSFRAIFKKYEDEGDYICSTIINKGERIADIDMVLEKTKFPKREYKKEENKSEKRRKEIREKTQKIKDFFKILEDSKNLLYLSKITAEIYGELYCNIKNFKNSNVSDNERKLMQNDLWIASLCIEHNAKLYSMDKHMEKISKIDDRLDLEFIPQIS